MHYNSIKVRDAMRMISQNEIFLPAIQRKFVWGPRKVEGLFDSIMRGYPIGTFLFWFVEGDTKNDYTFYKFIQDYHEKDNAINKVAPKPHLGEKFIGILDGQQRLNSLYVALQGSYAYRRKYAHWNNPASYPQRWLYLNLFYQADEDDESGVEYKFAFLTPERARAVDGGQFWFRVRDALEWDDMSNVFEAIAGASNRHPEYADKLSRHSAKVLTTLWQRLCMEDVISYFSVKEQSLDRIVDIFIRVNSTGVQLSKTDLLFSSIVAHWDGARAEIEDLIKALNQTGNGFAFDNDFIMRCCLTLTDLPVRLKVNSFRKENIERIQEHWDGIKDALVTTANLLVDWGFSRETLPTLNAVIPVAYFIFKGGDAERSNPALRQLLIRSLVNQIYRSKTDRVLSMMREHLRSREDGSTEYVLRHQIVAPFARLIIPEDDAMAVERFPEAVVNAVHATRTFLNSSASL